MKLTVVGCSGSFPGPDSPASCYLLEEEVDGRTWRILLDLGNGALGQLQRYADPLSIDALFISHLHADHCMDMCGYFVMRKYHPDGPAPVLPVWGPEGTADRVARGYDLPLDPGMREEFDFSEFGAPVTVGPFTIEAREVMHPVTAFALKVSAGGRTLVYSGDTGPCEALDEISAGADLLLAEAAFQHGVANPPDLHLTGRECGETALKAGVGRLVLTHVPPWYDPQIALAEALEVFPGRTDLAHAGAVYEV